MGQNSNAGGTNFGTKMVGQIFGTKVNIYAYGLFIRPIRAREASPFFRKVSHECN